MAKHNGNDIVLAVHTTDGSEIKYAHATGNSFAFTDSLIEVTSKDSNSASEYITGRKSWTLEVSGFSDYDDVTSANANEQFTAFAFAGSKIFWMNTRPATGLSSGDLLGWQGEAFINSITLDNPSDEASTYSISMTVTGMPTIVAAS